MHLVGARVGVWVRDQLDNHLLCFLQTLILGMCLKLPTFRPTMLLVIAEDGSPPGLPVGTLPQRTRDVDLPFVTWHTLPCFLIHKSNLRTCVAGTSKSVLLGRGAVAGGHAPPGFLGPLLHFCSQALVAFSHRDDPPISRAQVLCA